MDEGKASRTPHAHRRPLTFLSASAAPGETPKKLSSAAEALQEGVRRSTLPRVWAPLRATACKIEGQYPDRRKTPGLI
eukprot:scaffold1628_cov407-Prasinococcus_capsulatus_cf.AAC.27